MGEFVTTSAFRTGDPGGVLAAAGSFFAAYGWPAAPVDPAAPVTDDDVLAFAPVDGWTVLVWPGYFIELAAVEFMSRELGVLASTVHIHDGSYWSHALFRDGLVLDRFATMPDYFTEDPAEIARLAVKYAGQPAVVAEAFGRPVEDVAPYLVPVVLEDVEYEDGTYEVLDPEMGRAFPDDEHELDSPWVFIDFWRRLGPRYPADPSTYVARLRLAEGWIDQAQPGGDDEL